MLKSGLFSLPGKKTLTDRETTVEIVVMDVTEHEIERPKKRNVSITAGKSGGCQKSKNLV